MNEIKLTPREQEVLSILTNSGCSNRVIAESLDLSESTVKLHVGRLLKKFACQNRAQLILFKR